MVFFVFFLFLFFFLNKTWIIPIDKSVSFADTSCPFPTR